MPLATAILTERIEQKLTLLSQLRDLGRHQSALIQAGDMTQLLRLLAAKQRLLQALQSVESALDGFRGEDPESRVWASAEARRRCADAAASCEELLRTIVEHERQSESQMRHRREEAAALLQGARDAAEVHHAYLAGSPAAASRLDFLQG